MVDVSRDIIHTAMDTLPVEIIHRITTFLPCRSALSLLKNIIDSRHTDAQINAGEWPNFPIADPVELWARYALADSMSVQLMGEQQLNIQIHDIVKWLPQLMVTKHPLIALANLPKLCTVFTANTDTTPWTLQTLCFCISARLLAWGPDEDKPSLIEYTRKPPADQYLCAFATLMAGIMHCELLVALQQKRIRRTDIFSISNPAPPSAETIPFNFMATSMPPPFSPDVAEIFSRCHLPAMTNASFLEEGDWIGYYCYTHRNTIVFDPPMCGIRFTTKRSNTPGAIGLSAKGTDAIATFKLEGDIRPDTGRIRMRKQYLNNQGWDWNAAMTPFGIVGTWGTNLNATVGGWFWLWKAK